MIFTLVTQSENQHYLLHHNFSDINKRARTKVTLKKHIVLIGAGNLGRRHLEGLRHSKIKSSITVLDKNKYALELCRHLDIPSLDVRYITSMSEITTPIDLAIIATTSDSHLPIIQSLVETKAPYVILEKLAFNSLQDIEEASALIRQSGTKVWVNCTRRLYPGYSAIREAISGQKFINYTVTGNDYGLGCNGIHFLDLFSFLSGCHHYELTANEEMTIGPSKRLGYNEVFGVFRGKAINGCNLLLSCMDQNAPQNVLIKIDFDSGSMRIDERNRIAILKLDSGDQHYQLSPVYQSQLTGLVVDHIFRSIDPGLTCFNESMDIHRAFINAAYEVFSKQFGGNLRGYCPLT